MLFRSETMHLNIEFTPDSIGDFNTVMEVPIRSVWRGEDADWWSGMSNYYYETYEGVYNINLSGRGVPLQDLPNSSPVINFITVVEVNANDTDGDTISMSLGDDAPDFVSLNGNRIQFSSNAQPGTYTFTVIAQDGRGGVASKQLTVTSFGNNNDPKIAKISDQRVVEKSKIELNIDVIDHEGDNIILGLADDTPSLDRKSVV